MCGISLVCSNGLNDTIHNSIKGHLTRRGPDCYGRHDLVHGTVTLSFAASLLQLRGTDTSTVPIRGSFSNDLLLFNGEIFGGLEIHEGENDGHALLRALESSTEGCIVDILSRLRGPWSIIYWRASSSTVWFGRDFMGRRSLLAHWPEEEEELDGEGFRSWVISSVAVPLGDAKDKLLNDPKIITATNEERECEEDGEGEESEDPRVGWQEIPPGIYSYSLASSSKTLPHCMEDLQRHPWEDSLISQLHSYDRTAHGTTTGGRDGELSPNLHAAASILLDLMRQAVDTRCHHIEYSCTPCPRPSCPSPHSIEPDAPVMVLFSGGVDSVLVSALSHLSLPPHLPIDLCNVCFDQGRSPDRLSALSALEELSRWAPARDWRLILVNSSLSDLDANKDHLLRLLLPAGTVMDLNIGCALWLAAGGDGELVRPKQDPQPPLSRYCSKARVVLLGHGADEQCAGYGRHRTSFRSGGLDGLSNELKVDVRRMWKRNCGRDDRLIADRSREARHPFLDERVMEFVMRQPLSNITDLRQPLGVGDKAILRRVLSILGLEESSTRVKRAIQFGSRIGKQANRRDFGSNRAANKHNVGSMSISDVPQPTGRRT